MKIFVCGIDHVKSKQVEHNATHTLAIIEKHLFHRAVYAPGSEKTVMHLPIRDIELEGTLESPSYSDVWRLIRYLKIIPTDATLLIHCIAGVSRSTAAALIALYMQHKDVKVAVAELKQIRPQAQPNKLICKLADQILGNQDRELERASISDFDPKDELIMMTGWYVDD